MQHAFTSRGNLMKILHIGNEKNGVELKSIVWLSKLETFPTLEDALDNMREERHIFNLVFLSEEIWLHEPSKVMITLKNFFLTEDGNAIAITESETSEMAELLLLAGFYDYMTVPITESKLLFKMKQIEFEKRSLEKEKELIQAIQLLEEANEKLKSLTDFDPLTGVYNRRFLHSLISKIENGAPFPKKHVFLLMADIDAFKAFNDTYGHLKGDQCLQLVAKAMDESGKKLNGITARYGGEEFIMVIEDQDEKEFIKLAEEIRSSIENLLIPGDEWKNASRVTISIGTAAGFVSEKACYKNLLHEADQALYKAKELGGNRVCFGNACSSI